MRKRRSCRARAPLVSPVPFKAGWCLNAHCCLHRHALQWHVPHLQIEEVLALEAEGSAKHAELTAELKERQKKLDDLMESFAVSLLDD